MPEQGSSALAEDFALGLERGGINLAVLVDGIDGGASGIGEVDDLLCAHEPPNLDALGLQLSNVDNSSIGFHSKF